MAKNLRKNILVIYNDKDIKCLGRVEKKINDLKEDMVNEDREINYETNILTLFTDGSKITKANIGEPVVGGRVTHLYIDRDIHSIENSKYIIRDVYTPLIMVGSEYRKWDTADNPTDRVFVI